MTRAHQRDFEHFWTTVNGTTMYARYSTHALAPTAPTVVLVHGLAVSSGYMVPTARQLAPYAQVYLPDLPGFGKSAKPRAILTVPELADALVAWMQSRALPPAVLVGHSLGCQISIQVALKYPEQITHAVLVSPTMDPQARSIPQAAWRLARDLLCEPPSFLPVLVRENLAAGPRRTLGTLQSGFADHMEEHLSPVHLPTLIVRGARDPIVGQTWTEEVHRLLPQSHLVVVRGAGHAVNFSAPGQLVRLMRAFLSDAAPGCEPSL